MPNIGRGMKKCAGVMTNATEMSIPIGSVIDHLTIVIGIDHGGIGTTIEWIIGEEGVIGAVPIGGYLLHLEMIETEVNPDETHIILLTLI